MNMGERIKRIRTAKGLTQLALAQLVQSHQQIIQRLETGKTKNTSLIIQIAKALQVSPEYLQFGIEDYNIGNIGKEVINQKGSLPILTFEDLSQYDREVLMEVIKNPQDRRMLPVHDDFPAGCFVLEVQGDSMQSPHAPLSFVEGFQLIIDPNLQPKHNQYVIAKDTTNNSVYFRQYIIDGGLPYLKPLNSQYPVIKITSSIIILGVVNRAQQSYQML